MVNQILSSHSVFVVFSLIVEELFLLDIKILSSSSSSSSSLSLSLSATVGGGRHQTNYLVTERSD